VFRAAPQCSGTAPGAADPILFGMRDRGFTLVELIVAVTVLAVGVLAVAASAVPLGRLIARGGAQTASAAAAGARIEALRATACGAASGEAVAGGHGLRVAWTLNGDGAVRTVSVVATYPWGPGAHADSFAATVACPR